MTNDITKSQKSPDLNSAFEELIIGLIKTTVEKLIQEELSSILQYEKYSYDGRGTGNSRNGYYHRTYETKHGTIKDLKYREIAIMGLSKS